MSKPREPFEPNGWYHVFNHARGSDVIFSAESDYKTFLSLTEKYILPIARIYSYCLMPNHFHFLVQIKNIIVPENHKDKNTSNYIAHQWGTLQNTYTKKINYKRGTMGGLFCQSIDRNPIDSEEYRQMAVVYIHNNPVKHGFCTSPEDWKFSSFNAIISDGLTKVERDEVISWFETRENFTFYHKSNADEIYREKFNLR